MRTYKYKYTLGDLVKKYNCESITEIPYSELLQTRDWFVKRIEILNRDDFFCTVCGSSDVDDGLNIGDNFLYTNKNMISPFASQTQLNEGYTIKNYGVDKITKQPIYLHVHHMYYVKGKAPWDYPSDSLVTMCANCHFSWHEMNEVEYYLEDGSIINLTPCYRCNGAGHFPHFQHVESGICFRCKGMRFEEF